MSWVLENHEKQGQNKSYCRFDIHQTHGPTLNHFPHTSRPPDQLRLTNKEGNKRKPLIVFVTTRPSLWLDSNAQLLRRLDHQPNGAEKLAKVESASGPREFAVIVEHVRQVVSQAEPDERASCGIEQLVIKAGSVSENDGRGDDRERLVAIKRCGRSTDSNGIFLSALLL